MQDKYPRAFFEYLNANCQGFANIKQLHAMRYAFDVWRGYTSRARHSKDESCFLMPHKRMESRYHSMKNLHQINEATGLIERAIPPSEGVAAGYRLTDEAQKLIALFDAKTCKGFLDDGGKVWRVPRQAIRSLTKDGGKTKFKGCSLPVVVPVDMHGLLTLRQTAHAWLVSGDRSKGFQWAYEEWDELQRDAGTERASKRVASVWVKTWALLCMADSSPTNGIPMSYQESETGRLFAEGSNNLQECHREARRAALQGFWDVDISNCHFALMQQMAGRLGLQTPEIDAYLANKRGFRAEVAAVAGVSVRDAKALILGVMFGMDVKAGNYAHALETTPQVVNLAGWDGAKRLQAHVPIMRLQAEIASIRGPIIASYTKRGQITNDLGKRRTAKPFDDDNGKPANTPKHQLAFILQGAEAAILKAIIQHQGSNLIALIHDGVVLRESADLGCLEAHIHASTGYAMGLECSRF